MRTTLYLLLAVLFATGCSTVQAPPINTASGVDLERFMGDWYVIASIPTWLERGAHNGVESYSLAEDGTIDTTFSFRKGGFEGEPKTYRPRGFVVDDTSNAVWKMQFVWPFKADYRIVYVDADYMRTIIGRQKRDYVWIMARTPSIDTVHYERLTGIVEQAGYDITKLEPVPQNWDKPRAVSR